MMGSGQSTLRVLGALCFICSFTGCGPEVIDESREVIRVGVIVSREFDGTPGAEDTIRSAELIADAYNESGGLLVDGERYPLELSIVDYGDDSMQAVRVASHLIHNEGVHYFIGPDSVKSLDAVVPLYQAAGALFVHSAVSSEAEYRNALGLRGSPCLEQAVQVLCEFLRDERSVESVAVIAGMLPGAIEQKLQVEAVFSECGFTLRNAARYDVHEEVYNYRLSDAELLSWLKRVISEEPDVLLLSGFSPNVVPMVLQLLKEVDYSGEVVVLGGRGPERLEGFEALWEGVLFLGGTEGSSAYSDYYTRLQRKGMELSGDWNVETSIKLYALETIVRLIQSGGAHAISDPRFLLDILENGVVAEDPFYAESRDLRIVGEGNISSSWQIDVPLYISEVIDGVPVLLRSPSVTTEPK